MGLIDRVRSAFTPVPIERDYLPWITFNGVQYPLGLNQTLQGDREDPPRDYAAVIDYMYRNNPIVYACVNARVQLFSEARPMWRRLSSGVPGELFSTAELERLRRPWTNATTSDLLKKMGQYADTAGDAFVVRLADRLAVPRPDWMTVIVDGDVRDLGAPVYGYIYYPGGRYGGLDPVPLLPQQVAHYAPVPDPLLPHRGMSWLTPIVREVMADTAMTDHKRMFLVNGATPNLVVSLDPSIGKAAFDAWVEAFKKGHEGVANAYRTLYMGGGAKVEAVGKDLQQIDFKVVQGAGETRIAAAAGVPSVVAGFSEGMQGSSLNAGNYASSMRRFADLTMRPLWRDAFGSLASILSAPSNAELWYSSADIPALKDDIKDYAEVQSLQAQAIRTYVDAGFEPASAVEAINAGDLKRLAHTGLYSVQLQPPMPEGPPEPPEDTPKDDAEDEVESTGRALAFEALSLTRAAIDRPQPEPPTFNFFVTNPEHRTEVNVEPAAITVTPAPVEVRNEITVEPTPVEITVEPTPVTVEAGDVTVNMPEPKPVTKTIVREGGQITQIIEEPTDG